jgi:hypothetical protein
MRRRIEKPRILLLDCGLEYTKGESQTNIEVTKEGDFSRLLELEEECVVHPHPHPHLLLPSLFTPALPCTWHLTTGARL